jgi:isopentenyl diphosphate isomerase/L-lactate dehydrogenase-like FMN-dependent dehydrogenase
MVQGEQEVADVLGVLHDELDLGMALTGCRSVEEITPNLLVPG